jgi:tetratricopeptide (TPR) repeat protein
MKNCVSPSFRLLFAGFLICALLPPLPSQAAGEAEITLLVGKGEKREPESAAWLAAAVKQLIRQGGYVRTLSNSQMGLLLPDRTQIRLNQNSLMQIKSLAEAREWTRNAVRLNAGRAWSQARPQSAPQRSAPDGARVSMETPTATMSIRGTDWEVEVLPDGSTRLAVLSGTVDMANAHGSISVGRGEAALAEPGRAPLKFQLVNPRERVQWVSSWQPRPLRWARGHDAAARLIAAGDHTAAAALLAPAAGADAQAAAMLADLRLAQGEVAAAIRLLEPHARDGAGEAATVALLARALARADRLDEARRLLDAALSHAPNERELLLAAGELAVLDGDAAGARRALEAALARDADLAEAWHGIGRIESERENVAPARAALERALAADPEHSAARSERAAVESFAGNLAEAERLLDAQLAREPGDYAALTALGINLLKRGRAQEALEAFLKAGIAEPRYARAWLYSGVAFHQLDERARALEAFARAAEIDPRDPLPHLLESLVLAEALDYGAAIAAARRARERMPYLKSLNQLASDQKGSANVGSALANFGLEEWAGLYAYRAYSSFWAGSHFFQSDRHTGEFNKNSELIKGYLTDPTSFGASNRTGTLVAAPGHYGKLELYYQRSDWHEGALIGTLNGLSVEPVPVAYFLSGSLATSESREDPTTARGNNLTLGLGARPRHDVGLFGFATDSRIDGDLRTADLPDDRMAVRDRRADLGANFKLAPDNQLWFKLGGGRQSSAADGALVSQDIAAALNRAFASAFFTPNGSLERYEARTRTQDLQFRHALGGEHGLFAWGVERAGLRRPAQTVVFFAPARLSYGESRDIDSEDLYVSALWRRPGPIALQAELWRQRSSTERGTFNTMQLLPSPAAVTLANARLKERHGELNPRLGLVWQARPDLTLRLAAQRWRRPASVGTLAPVDTVGLAVNDRLPMAGGLYTRARLQLEREWPERAFLQAFLDHERIDNGLAGMRSSVPNRELTELESLRNRRDVFTAVADIEETPEFVSGRVNTLGLAGNLLAGARQTLSARYLRRHAAQTGDGDGLRIPYLPRDMLRLASHWSLPGRWLLGASATWRGARYRDARNLERIDAGWAFGFTAYRESADKRASVQLMLDNLLPNRDAGVERDARLTLQGAYRF